MRKFILPAFFTVLCWCSCVKPEVITDRFEAGMEMLGDTRFVSSGEGVSFRITANHNFDITAVDTDNEQIRELFAVRSYTPKGGVVDFKIPSFKVDRSASVKFSVELHCASPESTLTLSCSFRTIKVEEPQLEVITPEIIAGEPFKFRILSSYASLKVKSIDSPFVFPGYKAGGEYSVDKGNVEFVSEGFSASEDKTGKIRVTVYIDESDREYVLEGSYSVYVPLKAELVVPSDMEYDKPFSFSIKANRAFKVEAFSMNLSSERGMSDPSVDKSRAMVSGERFYAGGVYRPDNDGVVHVSIDASYIHVEADHDGYISLELSSSTKSADKVNQECGYHAKAKEPDPVVYPESIEVTLDGKVYDGKDVVRLVSGQEMKLGFRVLPEGAVGELQVALGEENPDVLSLVTTGNDIVGFTRKVVAGGGFGESSLYVKCGDVVRKVDFYVRRRVALVVDMNCKEDFTLGTITQSVPYRVLTLLRWSGLPYSMEMSLCTWSGEDKLSSLADSRVYPDLSDFSFQRLNGSYSGKVEAEFSLESRPKTLRNSHFAFWGELKGKLPGVSWYTEEAFTEYNLRESVSTPVVQKFVFNETESLSVEPRKTDSFSSDILTWLYAYDDYLIGLYQRVESGSIVESIEDYHRTEWEDIRLVPVSIDYDRSLLEVRYVVFRYQFKSGGNFVNKMVPYWLTENYNSPAIVTWKK